MDMVFEKEVGFMILLADLADASLNLLRVLHGARQIDHGSNHKVRAQEPNKHNVGGRKRLDQHVAVGCGGDMRLILVKDSLDAKDRLID